MPTERELFFLRGCPDLTRFCPDVVPTSGPCNPLMSLLSLLSRLSLGKIGYLVGAHTYDRFCEMSGRRDSWDFKDLPRVRSGQAMTRNGGFLPFQLLRVRK